MHVHCEIFKHHCKALKEKSVFPLASLFTAQNDLLLQRTFVNSFFCFLPTPNPCTSIYAYENK